MGRKHCLRTVKQLWHQHPTGQTAGHQAQQLRGGDIGAAQLAVVGIRGGQLPNGRVQHGRGDGDHPLVLIAHGLQRRHILHIRLPAGVGDKLAVLVDERVPLCHGPQRCGLVGVRIAAVLEVHLVPEYGAGELRGVVIDAEEHLCAVFYQVGEVVELAVAQNAAIPEGLAVDAHNVVGIQVGLHPPLAQGRKYLGRPGKSGLAVACEVLTAEV